MGHATTHVIPLPTVWPSPHQLTLEDRQQAAQWAAGPAGRWLEIMIYADPNESDEMGDFISVYRLGEDWASWGVARRGDFVTAWEAQRGRDLGLYSTMLSALAAIWVLPGSS
jgi:hypothetical protein